MKTTHKLALLLGLTFSITTLTILILILFLFLHLKRKRNKYESEDTERSEDINIRAMKKEELVVFEGGEGLTVCDLLEAEGEVIGKSNCGALYRASLQRSETVRILRFLRPSCITGGEQELEGTVRVLGGIRHPNLVPLLGVYSGPRGERLLLHPFYQCGNLAHFIRGADGDGKCYNWATIYRISHGIATGLFHLHAATLHNNPIIHGNLKPKNILLHTNYNPCVSDYGLHLFLNPTASQELLEASASEGYKAPELMKMKDASEKSDVYSLGVILLELLSGKKSIIHENPTCNPDEDFYLPDLMRRSSDLCHPAILSRKCRDDDESGAGATEECILKFLQLAMACCAPSPLLRPNIGQVLWKLEEIVK